ncbi:hypothetical protein DFH08DRAFT_807351 [Mycena albidolilacea]|uniref:Uncharacterized protein n=1 Tax=Mycena albidolilacea TaxID=1033008 RepID=A0AAD7A5N8_9AGAR|nr:hypothetical protein DFH08DRAFT_807351 [Mycena albidolilacea]
MCFPAQCLSRDKFPIWGCGSQPGIPKYNMMSYLECPDCHQMIHVGTVGPLNLGNHKTACKPSKGITQKISDLFSRKPLANLYGLAGRIIAKELDLGGMQWTWAEYKVSKMGLHSDEPTICPVVKSVKTGLILRFSEYSRE